MGGSELVLERNVEESEGSDFGAERVEEGDEGRVERTRVDERSEVGEVTGWRSGSEGVEEVGGLSRGGEEGRSVEEGQKQVVNLRGGEEERKDRGGVGGGLG